MSTSNNKIVALLIFFGLTIGLVRYSLGSKDFHVEDHTSAEEDMKRIGHVLRPSPTPARTTIAGAHVAAATVLDVDIAGSHDGGDRAQRSGKSLLDAFINDPSFSSRCTEPPVPTGAHCPSWPLATTAVPLPDLVAPISTGPTTKGMRLRKMAEVVGYPIAHHPIFSAYAGAAFAPPWLENRVVEFTGAHTDYTYDCGEDVDFRLYHQCRAAMCLAYEQLRAAIGRNASARQIGMFPLNDEEYFEMVMTLTTAMQAAEEGRGYAFIELGARYGTWIVRAGAAFRTMTAALAVKPAPLRLLAVEGNCGWFQKMREHVECNGMTADADLVLAYAAPRSFNKVQLGKAATFKEPRAVSLLDMLPSYDFVDMIDFDIQGFEFMTIQEEGAFELMSARVGFVHFGTHSTDIERNIATHAQANGWCVVYFFAGAHTKKLNRGHKCQTPFGPSLFNDGVLGIANPRFYPQLKDKCPKLSLASLKKTATTCHHVPEVLSIMRRSKREG